MDSIRKSEHETKILALCERHLGPLGFRAVDVDCRVAPRSLVRVFIEKNAPTPEVAPNDSPSVDDCANASRLLGEALESENVIPGAYDLEISSPGLDRRLRLKSDFERAVGEQVKLKLFESIPGRGANLTGTLTDFRPDPQGPGKDQLVVQVDGKPVEVPFNLVMRANRVWKF